MIPTRTLSRKSKVTRGSRSDGSKKPLREHARYRDFLLLTYLATLDELRVCISSCTKLKINRHSRVSVLSIINHLHNLYHSLSCIPWVTQVIPRRTVTRSCWSARQTIAARLGGTTSIGAANNQELVTHPRISLNSNHKFMHGHALIRNSLVNPVGPRCPLISLALKGRSILNRYGSKGHQGCHGSDQGVRSGLSMVQENILECTLISHKQLWEGISFTRAKGFPSYVLICNCKLNSKR